jgi:hypothetical protein
MPAGYRAKHWPDTALDGAMIPLNLVIQILAFPNPDGLQPAPQLIEG